MIVPLFWALVGIVAFAFVGFPVSVIMLGAILQRRYARARSTPSVSVLIAAYNEAPGIEAKIQNVLDQAYPADRLNVVVVDDGSTDSTADVLAAIDDPRVHVIRSAERGGKVAALNAGIGACGGDVVVYTDANAEFERDAIAELIAPFGDSEVGGVCGNQLNKPGRGALALGERLYWEYDKLVKRMESLTGSIVAADGSIYALRRELVEPVPAGVTDDFFLSTAVIKRGRRLVFAERARSLEVPLERGGDHFRRRVRITQQALESVSRRRDLLNPMRHGVYAYVLFGHKVVRRAAAPCMLALFPVSALAVPEGAAYALVFTLNVLVYVAALLGAVLRDRVPARVTAAPTYFVLGIVATSVGMLHFLRGRRRELWEPVRS